MITSQMILSSSKDLLFTLTEQAFHSLIVNKIANSISLRWFFFSIR